MNFDLLAHVMVILSEVAASHDSRRIKQVALQLRDYVSNPSALTIRSSVRPIADVQLQTSLVIHYD